MPSWRLAECLKVLQGEVNGRDPNRPKGSDGTIGDAAHAARKSSHNPDARGAVRAWDITTAPFCDALAEHLRHLGQQGDKRVLYVIWNRRIVTGASWTWRTYTGSDPHTGHIHLSVSDDPGVYDTKGPWGWNGSPQPTPPEVHPVSGSPRVAITQIKDGRTVVLFEDGGVWISPGAGGGQAAGATAFQFSCNADSKQYGSPAVDLMAAGDGILVLFKDGHVTARYAADPGDAI